ncbi:MAG: ExbD/TolR family protein [Sphingomonadaceae bacterium]|nr:ExbD/TolR family protein [Sphingomonadaceae bacterium]
MAEINVTPFVDVMLVLLIIFMVTAPMLNAGVPVELPESRANALPQEQQELVVTVAGDGTIYLDDSALAPGELGDRLANVIPDDSGQMPSVTLRAEKTLDYGRVMAVMGELNRAGFTSISLVTGGSDESP